MDDTTPLYFVGVKFSGSDKSYFFSTVYTDLKIGDLVVVETVTGFEIATVCTSVMNQASYHSELALKPIIRKPTEDDLIDYNFNLEESKKALRVAGEEIKYLGLPMNLIDAYYTLDGSKVTITYSSDGRVDFRELLHRLAPRLHCRIDLRQIAARDEAKIIGGMGVCGLPLCCSTFLTDFSGISLAKAKNQMLTINIPKLSGPCTKLICCLAYEDDLYTEAKKEFPRPGTILHLDEGDYSVDSFNILSRKVRLVNAGRDDWKTYSLEDVLAIQKGTYKKPEIVEEKKDDLFANFAFKDQLNKELKDSGRNDRPQQAKNQNQNNSNRNGQGNGRNNRHHGHGNQPNGQNRGNQNGNPQNNRPQNNGNRPQQGQQNNQQGKPHHNHHHHGHGGQGNRGGNPSNNGGTQGAK